MKWVDAMRELIEGKKVKHLYWNKENYIIINEKGFVVDEKGNLFDLTLIESQIGWLVVDERKKVSAQWEIIYKKINEAKDFLDSYVCGKDKLFNYDFENASNTFYELYDILNKLNKEYRLGNYEE